MSISTKRACDACHRRKVRCNSHQPCGNCSQAGLSCTYDAIPQKKGPKGSRAKVISELRETQKHLDNFQERQQQHDVNDNRVYGSPPGSPTYAPTPGLLTHDLVESCVDFFFTHMYTMMPILSHEQLQQIDRDSFGSVESYCLTSALCGYMLIQPGIASKTNHVADPSTESITSPQMGQALMDEAMRVRKGFDYIENPSVVSVITSFFLFGCGFGLNKHNTAANALREATGQALSLSMHDEQTYSVGDLVENSRKRRLFWLLFVTERAYALQKHLPLALHATISPPDDVDPQFPTLLTGFNHLINLYRPFDDTFIGLWNKSRNDCSALWLAQLQQQLTQALPAYLSTTESQAADLRCSQQWLRTVVWQLSITNGYLSSASQDSSMTFRYPIEIARDLVAVMSGLSKTSMEIHGIGLIEKVFDVACTLIDVMSCVPPSPPTPTHHHHHHHHHPSSSTPSSSTTPQAYLNQLLLLISTLRGGESRYLPLVMAKIRDTLPGIAPKLPRGLVGRDAVGMGGGMQRGGGGVNGLVGGGMSGFGGMVDGSDVGGGGGGGSVGNVHAVNGVGAGVGLGMNIKRESGGSSSTSGASSPYETPSFLHYYPLA